MSTISSSNAMVTDSTSSTTTTVRSPTDIKEAIHVLSLPDTSLTILDKAVTIIRDKIDSLHTAEYTHYVNVVPHLCTLLDNRVTISLQSTTPENICRNKTLEVILRLPNNDALRPHIPIVLRTLVQVALQDNEDNAATAIRTLVSYQKVARTGYEELSGQVFDFALTVFNNMAEAVTDMLNDGYDANTVADTAAFGPGARATERALAAVAAIDNGSLTRLPETKRNKDLIAASRGKLLCPSTHSFRVAQELPVPLLLAIQQYPALAPKFSETFRAMLAFLRLVSIPDLRSLAAGNIPSRAASTSPVTGDDITRAQATRLSELICAQVKVCAVFGWMVKNGQHADAVKASESELAPAVLRLFACVPPESPSLRRELVAALNLFVQSEVRSAFSRNLGAMLDRRVLLGGLSAVPDAIRSSAYRTLADLLHHVRDTLTVEQVAAVTDYFTPVIMDASLGASLAAVALRLLLNLVEKLFHSPGPDRTPARSVMTHILNVMVYKLGSLRAYIPRVLAAERRTKADEERDRNARSKQLDRVSATAELVATQQRAKSAGASTVPDATAEMQAKILFEGIARGTVSPWLLDEYNEAVATNHVVDSPRQLRDLVRVIVQGMRPLLWSLLSFARGDTEAAQRESASGLGANVEALPVTPGIDNAKLQDAEMDSGTNGLGSTSHGAVLSEADLVSLRNFALWSLDAMDLYLLSPSASSSEAIEVMEYYAGAFNVMAEKDRNHLRELLVTAVPAIMERCFEHPSMLNMMPLLLVQNTAKVMLDMLLSIIMRHIHLLNAHDDDPAHEWRHSGVMTPCTEESHIPDTLPRTVPVNKRNKPTMFGSTTMCLERCKRGMLRTRMLASGDWQFNEDGEFDDVLDGHTLYPDTDIMEQRDSLPTSILSPADMVPQYDGRTKRYSDAAAGRINCLLRVFKMVMYHISQWGKSEHANNPQALETARQEALFMLRNYIGPIIRASLRNMVVARSPAPHLYLVRMLLRHVSMDMTDRSGSRSSTLSGSSALIQVYAEFASVAPLLIDTLMRLHAVSTEPKDRESMIEICLSIPVRLNMQLVHLGRTMKPIILGLRSRDDTRNLVGMSIRTLDYWVENISPLFFQHVFSQEPGLQGDLMNALTALLKPGAGTSSGGSNPSGDVLRLLGKLGGLNRLHLSQPPKLQHVGYSANGLVVRASWHQSSHTYLPPNDIQDHNQQLLEQAFEGVDETSTTYALPNHTSVDEEMDEKKREDSSMDIQDESISNTQDKSMNAALEQAQRAVAKLRGKKANISSTSISLTSSDSKPSTPTQEQDFDLPLDRIIHYAGGMLVRHYEAIRDNGETSIPSTGGSLATRYETRRRRPIRTIRKRAQPSAGVGSKVSDDYTVPVRRRRRLSETGEPQAITSTGATRALPVDAAATASAGGRINVYGELLDSDSDSSGEEDTTEIGVVTLSPTQMLLLSTRGPLSAKRQAWDLISAAFPLILEQFPAIANADVRTAANHLYTEQGTVRTPSASTPASSPGPDSSTSASAPSHGLHASIEQSAAMRRVQLEYLRVLSVASVDNHLRSLALPLLLKLVRHYVARAITLTPVPQPETLPEVLRDGTIFNPNSLTNLRVPTLRSSSGGSAPTGDEDHVSKESRPTNSSLPMGSEDPLVLNVLITSLACDEPLANMGPAGFRPVLLNILDEIHNTLCLAASKVVGATGNLSRSATDSTTNSGMDIDSTTTTTHLSSTTSSNTPMDDHHATSTTSSTIFSTTMEVRRLHATCVTGRMLIGDLILRLASAVFRPTARSKQGGCYGLIALLSRLHPVAFQYYAYETVRTGLFTLRTFPPESAPITVSAALHLLRDSVQGLLPPVTSPEGQLSHMQPIESLLIHNHDKERLRIVVRQALEGIISPTAAAREGSAFILGSVVRHFLTLSAASSTIRVTRGMFTLMEPWTKMTDSQRSPLPSLFFRRSLRMMRQAEQIGLVYALSSILHLATQALATDASDGPQGPAIDAPWRQAVNAFTSGAAAELANKLDHALKVTRAHDPNYILLNPAYASSVAHMITSRSADLVTGLHSHALGVAAAPITVAGALQATHSVSGLHMVNISSASNPPIEPVRTPAELHSLLSAAQSFPYPMRWPPVGVSTARAGLETLSDAQADPLDPFQAEQIGDGRLYAHMYPLPIEAGVTNTNVSPSSPFMSNGYTTSTNNSTKTWPTAPWGVSVWIAHLNNSGLLEGGNRYEEMLRGKLADPTNEFRYLTFPVLFRCGTLRLVEAFSRALPPEAVPIPAPDATADQVRLVTSIPSLRENAFRLFFEHIPLVTDSPYTAKGNYIIHQDPNIGPIFDKTMPLVTQATGHFVPILSATHDALIAFMNGVRTANGMEADSQARGVPRDLKDTLRPLLSLFSDHQKLKIANVDTLASMLPATSHYFNVILATKLLEDLGNWLQVNSIREKLGNSGREPDIAAAVMNLFHLLPLDVNAVLPRFVRMTCLLEAKLHQFRSKGPITSPFRTSFARFMSRYPAECAKWFFSERRLLNPAYGKLLANCVELSAAAGFRTWLSGEGEAAWLHACFPDYFPAPPASTTTTENKDSMEVDTNAAPSAMTPLIPAEYALLHYRGIQIMDALQSSDPSWLPQRARIVDLALQLWNSPEIQTRLIATHVSPHSFAGTEDSATATQSLTVVTNNSYKPWSLPRTLWEGYFPDIRILQGILVRTVRQSIHKARSVAASFASTSFITDINGSGLALRESALSLPSCSIDQVTAILLSLCKAISVHARLPFSDLRYFLETEFATAPSGEIRGAILRTFIALQQVNPDGKTVVSAPVDDAIRVTGIRCLVLPMVRHVGALEEDISAVLIDQGREACARAYLAAGGSFAAAESIRSAEAVNPSSSTGTSLDARRTRTGSFGLDHELDTSGHSNTAPPDRTSTLTPEPHPSEAMTMLISSSKPEEGMVTNISSTNSSQHHSPILTTRVPSSNSTTEITMQDRTPSAVNLSSTPSTSGVRMGTGIYTGHGYTSIPTPNPTGLRSTVKTPSTNYGRALAAGLGTFGNRLFDTSMRSPFTSPGSLWTPYFASSISTPSTSMPSSSTASLSWANAVLTYTPPHRGFGQQYQAVPAEIQSKTFGRSHAFPRLLGSSWLGDFITLLYAANNMINGHWTTGVRDTTLESPTSSSSSSNKYPLYVPPSDELRTELLRLMDAVMIHATHEPLEHRKILVRFAWALLKSSDLLVRQHAYIALCRYLQVFPAPGKTSFQVFGNLIDLLRTHLDAIRFDLWRRAMNILLPTMALRLTLEDEWKHTVRMVRKKICDELHNIQTAAVLWTVVLDHARLFYPYRAQLVPNMVSTAHKLVLQQTSQAPSLAHKELLVGLMHTLTVWQAQIRLDTLQAGLPYINASSADSSKPKKDTRVGLQYPTPSAGWGSLDVIGGFDSGRGENLALTEWVVGFTARAAILCTESVESRPLIRRTIDLLAAMLRLWPDVPLGRHYMNKPSILSSARSALTKPDLQRIHDETNVSYLTTVGEILLLLSNTEGRARDFLPEHVGFVLDTFVAGFGLFDRNVLTIMRRVLRRFLILYPHNQGHPPGRLQHVRFYPCVASAIVASLCHAFGLAQDRTNEFARVISDSFQGAEDVRKRARDENIVLQMIALGVVAPPGGGPCVPDPSVVANSTYSAADLARGATVAPRAWPEFTQERARRLVNSEREDDEEARHAWLAVSNMLNSPPVAPNALADHIHTQSLVRLLRECAKFAPTFSLQPQLHQLVQVLLHKLVNFHIECEEIASKVAARPNEAMQEGLSFKLSEENDPHLNSDIRNIQSGTLAIMVPMLCTRVMFLSALKSTFLNYVCRLAANSSDAGVLRTCFKVLSHWITASPAPRSNITYGLTQKEKILIIDNTLQFLAIQAHGTASLAKDVVVRIQKLAPEVYSSMQAEYYRLLLRLYTGSDTVGTDPLSAHVFVRQMYKLLHASGGSTGTNIASSLKDSSPILPHLTTSWTRPSAYWFQSLQRSILPGMICADINVRNRCYNLVIAHVRVRRVFEMREELRRNELAREALRFSFESRAVRRRNEQLYGMATPIVSYDVADPFNPAYRLPISVSEQSQAANAISQAASSGLPNGEERAQMTKFTYLVGDDQVNGDVWHSQLDANTAAALEAAYTAAVGMGPHTHLRDSRPRLSGFAGFSSPIDQAYACDPITSLQDIVSCDWEHIMAYASLPTVTRLLLRAVNGHRTITSNKVSFDEHMMIDDEIPAKQNPTVGGLEALLRALDGAVPFSLDMALHVWSDLLPKVWKVITPEQRKRITPHILGLLSRDAHNHHLYGSNPVSQLEITVGVYVKERERDFGTCPLQLLSGYNWSGLAASAPAIEGLVGPASSILGTLEDASSDSIYTQRGIHDISNATSLQLLLSGIVKCDPPIDIPAHILSALSRGVIGSAVQDITVPKLEAKLEQAVAKARVADETFRSAAAKVHPQLFSSTSSTLPAPTTSLVSSSTVSSTALTTSTSSTEVTNSTVTSSTTVPEPGASLYDSVNMQGDIYSLSLAPLVLRDGIKDEVAEDDPLSLASVEKRSDIVTLSGLRSKLAQAKHEVSELANTLSQVYSNIHADDLSRGIRRRFATTIASVRLVDMEAAGLWQEVADMSQLALVNTRDAAELANREDRNSRLSQQTLVKNVVSSRNNNSSTALTTTSTTTTAPTSTTLIATKPSDAMDIVSEPSSTVLATTNNTSSTDQTTLTTTLSSSTTKKLSVEKLLSGIRNTKNNKRHVSDVYIEEEVFDKSPIDYNATAPESELVIANPVRFQLQDLLSTPPKSNKLYQLLRNDKKGSGVSKDKSKQIIHNRIALLRSVSVMNPIGARAHAADDGDVALLYADGNGTGPSISSATSSTATTSPSGTNFLTSPRYDLPPTNEVTSWEERWVEANRALSQWDVLKEYARTSDDPVLYGEALSKAGDFDDLRRVLSTSPALAVDGTRNHVSRLYSVETNIRAMELQPAVTAVDDASNIWLREWSVLPPFMNTAHERLLASSQRLCEARDAVTMMNGVKRILDTGGDEPRDIKNILSTWRERLPNRWDGSNVWSGIMNWRQHVFNFITQTLGQRVKDHEQLSAMHDSPWTFIKLAHIARKLGLRTMASLNLERLGPVPTMDIHDQFSGLKEMLYLHLPEKITEAFAQYATRRELYKRETAISTGSLGGPDNPRAINELVPCWNLQPYSTDDLSLARIGLDAVSGAAVNLYSDVYRAAIFLARAQYLEVLGERQWPSAYVTYAAAAINAPAYAKSWLLWGQYLDRLFHHLRVEITMPHVMQLDANAKANGAAIADGTKKTDTETANAVALGTSDRNPLIVAAELVAKFSGETGRQRVAAAIASVQGTTTGPADIGKSNDAISGTTTDPSPSTTGSTTPVATTTTTTTTNATTAPSVPVPLHITVAAQAVTSYLVATAMRCVMAPMQLARPLYLLGYEDGSAALTTAFANGVNNIPAWLWIPWIPQLLAGLVRPEWETCRRILLSLAVAYPQAIHYAVRSFVVDKREAATASGGPTAAPRHLVLAYERSYDVYNHLRRLHASCTGIDEVVEEITNRAGKISMEEDTMNYLAAYTSRALTFQHGLQTQRLQIGNDTALLNKLNAKDLDFVKQVQSHLFKFATAKLVAITNTAGQPAGAVSRTNRFVQRYRRAFYLDFCPRVPANMLANGTDNMDTADNTNEVVNPHAPTSVEVLLSRMSSWRNRLTEAISVRRIHGSADLHVPNISDAGTGLLELTNTDLEIPGQYINHPVEMEPIPSHHVRIAHIEPRMHIVITGGIASRRIIFIGDDGRRHSFLIAATNGTMVNTDARVGQAMSFANMLMSRYHASRSRNLALTPQITVPLTNRMRLVADIPATLMLSDVLERHLEMLAIAHTTNNATKSTLSTNNPPGTPEDTIAYFRNRLNVHLSNIGSTNTSASSSNVTDDILLAAYRDVCGIIPDTLLASAFTTRLSSPEALATLRNRFRTQSAVHALWTFLLSMPERLPSRMGVILSSGNLVSFEARPMYNSAPSNVSGTSASLTSSSMGGIAEMPETVPFRLTRNMVSVITPQGIVGPVAASMIAGARSMFVSYDVLLSYLTLFFRDEVIAHFAARTGGTTSSDTLRSKSTTDDSTGSTNATTTSTNASSTSNNAEELQLLSTGPGATAACAGVTESAVLQRRIASNAFRVLDRINDIQLSAHGPNIPTLPPWLPTTPDNLLRTKALVLLTMAMSEKYLARMPHSWHPWM